MSALRVACAADERYLAHCATMVSSLRATDHGRPVEVHFLHAPSLPAPARRRLEAMARPGRLDVVTHAIAPDAVAGLPAWGRIPATMWYRILLPELMGHATRVLYLDADVLVLDSLAQLWDTDLNGAWLGAVTNVPERHMLGHAAELGLPGPESYFNSGVLLLDLEAMRRDDRTAALRACVAEQRERLLWPDQDALNLVLGTRRHALHPRFNFMNSVRLFPWAADLLGAGAVREAIDHPAIVHFEGPDENKPWHLLCDHPFRRRYAAYRRDTPWPHYRRQGLTPVNALRLLRRRAG